MAEPAIAVDRRRNRAFPADRRLRAHPDPALESIADLADRDTSVWVNQTGTSGHAFHPHYSDQTEAWVDGEVFPWAVSRQAVEDSAEQTLLLVPSTTDD